LFGWQSTIDLLFDDRVQTNPTLHQHLSFCGSICGHDYCNDFPDVMQEVNALAEDLGADRRVVGTFWSVRVPNLRRRGAELHD
jgi:hypothetical protein